MKKRGRKILAAVLSLALFVQLFPLPILAEQIPAAPLAQPAEPEDTQDAPAHILAEDESLRTENEKHFRMSDGTYMAAVYEVPVHYLDENGEYQDIDNTLESAETGEAALETRDSGRKVKFAKNAGKKKLVTIQEKGYHVSWGYEGAASSAAETVEKEPAQAEGDDAFLALPALTSETAYREVFPGVDLQYIVSPVGVKENILLRSPAAKREFTIRYQVGGGLKAVQQDARTIALRKGEETVYTLSAPVMTDAGGAASDALTLTLEENRGGNLTVRLAADSAWLDDEARQYPVVLDPSFTTDYNDSSSVQTRYVMQYDKNHADGTLFAGWQNGGMGQTQSLVRFPSLPALSRGDVVVDAWMSLAQTDYSHVGAPELQVDVYEITQTWDWGNTGKRWQTGGAPGASGIVQDYALASASTTGGQLNWNITRLVRQWYEGGRNYGVLLKAHDSTQWALVHLASKWTVSAFRPLLQITYLNNKGLESYWDYTSQDFGSGVSYVNNFSGNLVVELPISHTNSANLPVEIGFVYNGYQAGSHFRSDAVSGWGWKLNYDRRVDALNPNSSSLNKSLYDAGYHYKYVDEDGTELYFKKRSSGIYEDEVGKGLTLTVSGNQWVMTDKQDNKQVFDTSGRLIQIQGNQSGDKITLSYTGGILTSITDGAGKVTKLERTNATVTAIEDPYGRRHSFNYSGGYLTKITYPDGKTAQFSYQSDHHLKTITLRDGARMEYAYGSKGDVSSKSRVASVTEYSRPNASGTREKGNAVQFTYGASTTTVKDRSRTATYNFDSFGRTTSAIDDTGAASTVYTATSSQAGKMYTNNKVGLEGASALPANNLLTNHSFEDGLNKWNNWHTDRTVSTASVDSSKAYIGAKAAKINKTTTTGSGMVYQRITNPEPGYYTLSAYVAAQGFSGSGGARLHFEVYDTSGEYTVTYSSLKRTAAWERLSLTVYVPAGTPSIQAILCLTQVSGTAWFDCVQLEKGEAASEYNLIENAFFDNGAAGWAGSTGSIGAVSGAPAGIQKAVTLTGAYGLNNRIYQEIPINMPASQVAFNLSGYAVGNAVPRTVSGRYFALDLKIIYTDGTYEFVVPSFNPHTTAWQFTSRLIMPKKGNQGKRVKSVEAYCVYYDNANSAKFSGLSLQLDKTGAAYSYDAKGNLVSAKDMAEREQLSTIDSANRLTKYTDQEESTYQFTYDSTYKHRVTKATYDPYKQQFAYTYNSHGQPTQVVQSYTASSSVPKIRSSSTYSSDGSQLLSQTDSIGSTVDYQYNAQNLLQKATQGSRSVSYTYDTLERPLSVSASRSKLSGSAETVSNGYSYANDLLTGITHNGFTYGFEYNLFGQTTKTKVGSQPLITNTYGANNGLLLKSTYGNGAYVENVYDRLERVTGKKYNGVLKYEWVYDSQGRAAAHRDKENGKNYQYAYDMLGRVTTVAVSDQNQMMFEYNNLDQVTRTRYFDGGTRIWRNTNYAYKPGGVPYTASLPNSARVEHVLNELAQEKSRKLTTGASKVWQTDYTFYSPSSGYTSSLVNGVKHSAAGLELTYEYDQYGNITKVKENGTEKARYTYDTLGQLIREDSRYLEKTVTYEYDNGGNLVSRKEYAYTTGSLGEPLRTVPYVYGNAAWKDQLTAYDGQAITYDAIGNPLNYRDGMELTWKNGRQLSTLSKGGVQASYTYNADGCRTKKTVGGVTTEYWLDGGQIVSQKSGNERIWYYYDSNGTRLAMEYGGWLYYYYYNVQGDVLGLFDDTLNVVVEYEYDSWGNILSVTGSKAATVGKVNPFRYRGYFYDEESGLYYLQSRYYDPATGRFLNADGVLGANQDPLSY